MIQASNLIPLAYIYPSNSKSETGSIPSGSPAHADRSRESKIILAIGREIMASQYGAKLRQYRPGCIGRPDNDRCDSGRCLRVDGGATRITPGSHKLNTAPEFGTHYDSIPAEMPKGSVLVWPGNVWHGGGVKIPCPERTQTVDAWAWR